ncbi:cell envelope integrity protein TolA [Acinetobacter baumannii]|uniref:cell envelope integrity protein TolA n=1 Tax=Acinetobacter baumannii TaxID=470 RepID=UPI0016529EE1|nr:cell envelope integrity protein TolA [Acinetobacter baumannii]MBC6786678.1 protein TolA [Acinetobacter baumannii]
MNKNQKPPFKQNAIALSFTLGVHAIAIVGLLFLGLSKPPEQPKKLTTVLVKPEDLPPPLAKEVEQPTVAENQAEEVLSPIVDETLPQNLPAAPPSSTAQQLAAQKQKTEQAQQAKLAEEKRKAEEAAKAKQAAEQQRLEEAQKQQAEAKRQAEAKARAEAEQKRKAEQNAKAEADAKAKQQKAAEDAKRKAEADAKAKQQKAAEDARRKAEIEAEEKAASAKKAQEEAAQKKGEAKKIASSAKRDFEQKIRRAWDVPTGSSGKTVSVRFTLSDSGSVSSIVITRSSGDDALDASIKAAIQASAPYPMPSDPDARREARSVTSTFRAQ